MPQDLTDDKSTLVDPDPCRNMVLLGHNVLISITSYQYSHATTRAVSPFTFTYITIQQVKKLRNTKYILQNTLSHHDNDMLFAT